MERFIGNQRVNGIASDINWDHSGSALGVRGHAPRENLEFRASKIARNAVKFINLHKSLLNFCL